MSSYHLVKAAEALLRPSQSLSRPGLVPFSFQSKSRLPDPGVPATVPLFRAATAFVAARGG